MNDDTDAVSRHEQGIPNPSRSVQCVPVPEWVHHESYLTEAPESTEPYVDNGLSRVLYDFQVNLDGLGYAASLRTVQRIVSRAGAEKAAHFVVEFDPTFQRIEIHYIRVLRDQTQIDHAKVD